MKQQAIYLPDFLQIRIQPPNSPLIIQYTYQVTGNVSLSDRNSQSILHGSRYCCWSQFIDGKLHLI